MVQKNLLVNLFVLGVAASAFNSCSSLSRHPQSGYSELSHRPPLMASIQAKQYLEAAADQLGLNVESASPQEMDQIELRAEIIRRERGLERIKEKQQYYYYQPWLQSDQERANFLRRPNFQARQDWVHGSGIYLRYSDIDPGTQSLIEAKDIALGMQMQLVRKAWGEPTRKEVSGDPLYLNQKWTYSEYNPTPEGYQLQRRTVYFENGRVAGWKLDE